jgi:hypothetical protein
MGMEIVRLGENVPQSITPNSTELAKFSFSTHHIQNPPLSIWMMSSSIGQPIFPWWNYGANIDVDIQRLHELWSVTSPQSFFDCLYLSQFKKMAGQNFYAIIPGYLRNDGWDKLSDSARSAYLRGQGCVYRLEGAFDSKLTINWVPFAQPQCIIKDPTFNSFWSMFTSARNDDVANSVGFFSLADAHKLPQVASLLIQPSENRSIQLTEVVDWFGLYSSPITPDFATCNVIYSKNKAFIEQLAGFQSQFEALLKNTRDALKGSPLPHTAFRILSRLVAI